MKKFKPTILKTNLLAVALISMFAATSCNNDMSTKDSQEIAETSNEAKFSNTMENDAEFLVSAAELNYEEIELGKLAQINGSMPEVKELGKMMEVEHTKALNDLKTLAAKKEITIPATITDKGKSAYDKLKVKSGTDFDKEYCNMMVKGHKDAISKFEKGNSDSKDADIKAWAETTLISLRAHLDYGIACEEKCKKMKSKS